LYFYFPTCYTTKAVDLPPAGCRDRFDHPVDASQYGGTIIILLNNSCHSSQFYIAAALMTGVVLTITEV